MREKISATTGLVFCSQKNSFRRRKEGGGRGEEEANLGYYLEAAAELLVEEEAGELGGAGALEELDEDLAEGALQLVGGLLEGRVADEVGLVVVRLELLEQRLELLLVQVLVHLRVEQRLHLVEVRRVEPRRQQRLLYLRRLGGLLRPHRRRGRRRPRRHPHDGGRPPPREPRPRPAAEPGQPVDGLNEGQLRRRHICLCLPLRPPLLLTTREQLITGTG